MRLRLHELQEDDKNIQKLQGQKDYGEYDGVLCY